MKEAKDILKLNYENPFVIFAEEFLRDHLHTSKEILSMNIDFDLYKIYIYKDLSKYYTVYYMEGASFDQTTPTTMNNYIQNDDFLFFINKKTKSLYLVNDQFQRKRSEKINKNNISVISSLKNNLLAITLNFYFRYSFPKDSELLNTNYTIYFDLESNLPVENENMVCQFDGDIIKEIIKLPNIETNKIENATVLKYYNNNNNKIDKINIYNSKNKLVFGSGYMRHFAGEYYIYYDDQSWTHKIFNMFPYEKYETKYETKENFKKYSKIYLKHLIRILYPNNKKHDITKLYPNRISVMSSSSGVDYDCQKILIKEINLGKINKDYGKV